MLRSSPCCSNSRASQRCNVVLHVFRGSCMCLHSDSWASHKRSMLTLATATHADKDTALLSNNIQLSGNDMSCGRRFWCSTCSNGSNLKKNDETSIRRHAKTPHWLICVVCGSLTCPSVCMASNNIHRRADRVMREITDIVWF